MTYTTSEGVPFESSYTTDFVYQWFTQRGVSANVARQEATVDLLRYGNDLPGILDGMLPHLLERSGTQQTGSGSDSAGMQGAEQTLRSGAQQAQQAAQRNNQPAPVASIVTTMGATERAEATPTVGPIGLAYPDDPVNYATGQQSPAFGYSGPGALPSGLYGGAIGASAAAPAVSAAGFAPAAGSNMGVYLIAAGLAVAAYFLLRKK